MAEKLSGALAGKAWQSQLVHVQYRGSTVRARHQFHSTLDYIISNDDDYSIQQATSPIQSKITKITAHRIDLDATLIRNKFTEKALKHHFVEIQTESGHCFTLEKGTKCILLQSFRITDGDNIRHLTDGKKRKNLQS